jgi:hypothetical protein
MYLTNEYRDMIEIFNEHKVRYLVAGAYAMATCGYSRSTYDIDLWIDKDEKNVQKILLALDEFGLSFEITKDDLIGDNVIIQIGVAPIRIDILTDIDGVIFDEAYEKRIEHDFGGLIATVLHIDDILKNKIASNRAKDKIDVIELKKLKELK